MLMLKRIREIARKAWTEPVIPNAVNTRDVYFMGGPLDGEMDTMPVSQTRMDCGDAGHYDLEWIGFDGRIFEPVFVHSSCLLTEKLAELLRVYSDTAEDLDR